MRPNLFKLILVTGFAVFATQAIAQSSPPSGAATTPPPATNPAAAAPAGSALPQSVAANVRVANPTSVRSVTAAGSVIILADGIVANATIAQIRPPAPGFVYER